MMRPAEVTTPTHLAALASASLLHRLGEDAYADAIAETVEQYPPTRRADALRSAGLAALMSGEHDKATRLLAAAHEEASR